MPVIAVVPNTSNAANVVKSEAIDAGQGLNSNVMNFVVSSIKTENMDEKDC